MQADPCFLSTSPVYNTAVCIRQDNQMTRMIKCVYVISDHSIWWRGDAYMDDERSIEKHLPNARGLLIWHLAAGREEGSCSLLTDADIGVPLWHCALVTLFNTENKTSNEKFWQHELEIDCGPLRFTSGVRWWRSHCKYLLLTLCGLVLLSCTFSLL